MEQLSRKDIKEIFAEAITPLIVELKANKESHEKEIERLTKQSAEHYTNFKSIEDKVQAQVMKCSGENIHAAEKSGSRIGDLEKDVARIDEHVKSNTKTIKNIEDSKKFNITQWLVVVGIAVSIFLSFMSVFGG